MARLLARDQFPEELKWDLTPIYPTRVEWEADIEQIETDLADLAQYQGRLGEGTALLLACLQAFDRAEARAMRTATYASMQATADGGDTAAQRLGLRGAQVRVRMGAAKAAVEAELAQMPAGWLEACLAAEPGLALYEPYLRQVVRLAAHVLSPEAERAVAALSGALRTPAAVYGRILFADARFEPVSDRNGEVYQVGPDIGYRTIGRIPDQPTRMRAAASLTAGLMPYRHSMAAALSDQIQNQVAMARLRGYASAQEMLLAKDQVEMAVYRNLLTTLREELPQHVQRWVRVRGRVAGTPQRYLHDLWSPPDAEPLPPLTPEQGAETILRAMAPLGSEYVAVLQRAFRERWIDWADNRGKPAVQQAIAVPGAHPYVLTAWQSTYANARGLAHELGHVVHAVLAERHQPFRTQWSSRAFVEAPSTANELLFGYYLLDSATDSRLRREALHSLQMTYYLITVLVGGMADFEHRLFEEAEAGRPLTADSLSAMMSDVWHHYFGDTLEIDSGACLEWMLWPHLYSNMYLWEYSAGLCCAYGVVEAIRREGESAAGRWLDVLRLGGSLSPAVLMARAGVEILSPDAVRHTLRGFGRLIDELERSERK